MKDLVIKDVVILVEDNPIDAEMTIRALEKYSAKNTKIVWLKDGEEAIEYIFGHDQVNDIVVRLKLILLDIKMPKLDGFEVLTRLKNCVKTMHITVVMMTSSTDERDRLKSYKLGTDSFIIKCIDYAEFEQKIQKLNNWITIDSE